MEFRFRSACWCWRFRSSPSWRWSRRSTSTIGCARSTRAWPRLESRAAGAPGAAPHLRRQRRCPPPEPLAEPHPRRCAAEPPSPRRSHRPATAAARAAGLPPPHRPSTSISFEEKFGTRWTVWIGGVALALGGIFLVKYSIEAGLIGPRPAAVLRRAARGGPGRRRRMGAAAGEAVRASPACRPRISRASSPPPAPPSPMPRSMRPMRSTASSIRPSPSCCSAWWRWRRSARRCCTARRWPRSAWSAPM